MAQLLDLPPELICSLPRYIRNLEDFTNAASSCRALRAAFATTPPRHILHLAAASAPTFFSPHPWFLVMATARQVGDWAIGNEERTAALVEAFRGGIYGLYDLCLGVAGLATEDVRRLHLARFDILNPLSDRIDKMAGKQWYKTPRFWNGGVSEAATLHTDADRAAFQIIVYGELFGRTMKAFLEPARNLPRFDVWTRLEYVKYCVPDDNCRNGHPGLQTLPVGPYAPGGGGDGAGGPEDQVALRHILDCGRWNRMWDRVRRLVAPDFEDEWRQQMWRDAPQTIGLQGMELVTLVDKTGLSDTWRHRLLTLRAQIAALRPEQKSGLHTLPLQRWRIQVPDVPDLRAELYACVAGYWGAR
ncbi:hypothetical protein MGN70_011479 [Eutypa lata]|nr:hypothetical protein MGN70_011479 [Eutypa lata]